MTKVISFGHRCSSSSFIKLLNLKTESYPFDWMISKLNTIKQCIETDFKDFSNIEHYTYKNSETYNMINGKKVHICCETVFVNMLYETNPDNNQTYNYQLGFNHNNVKNDPVYYDRCIERFKDVLNSEIKKITIYFHPIVGDIDFNNNKTSILKEFNDFNVYIQTKTSNIFGLYFITVVTQNVNKSEIIESTDTYTVYVIYCNENFLDGGDPCMGNCSSEINEVTRIILSYI